MTRDRRYRAEGKWARPRQSAADALEQSAAMMERFNRIFLRTLCALCEMRRHGSRVVVKSGGQVNLNTGALAGEV
jgi:hypothetical protein